MRGRTYYTEERPKESAPVRHYTPTQIKSPTKFAVRVNVSPHSAMSTKRTLPELQELLDPRHLNDGQRTWRISIEPILKKFFRGGKLMDDKVYNALKK